MMVDFFIDGGHMMWVILLSGVLAGGLTVRAVLGLRRDAGRAAALGSTVDAVLFWGGFALVAGVLGTAVGVSEMGEAISAAGGSISTGIVWDGIRVALTTTIFGAVVCVLAGLAWLALRTALLRRRRSLLAEG